MGEVALIDVALKLIAQIGLPAATGFIGLFAWMWERKQNIALAKRHADELVQERSYNAAMQAKLMDLAVAQIQVITRVESEIEKLILTLGPKARK